MEDSPAFANIHTNSSTARAASQQIFASATATKPLDTADLAHVYREREHAANARAEALIRSDHAKSARSYDSSASAAAREGLRSQLVRESADVDTVVRTELARLYAREMDTAASVADARARIAAAEEKKKGDEAAAAGAVSKAAADAALYTTAPSAPDEPYTLHELYLRRLQHARVSGGLGSVQSTTAYRPRRALVSPPDAAQATVAMLTAAGAHLGHNPQRLHRGNLAWIYGTADSGGGTWNRKGPSGGGSLDKVSIIDLEKTVPLLRRACKVLETVAYRGGVVVFVGTRPGQDVLVHAVARRASAYAVVRRWVPGTLTNAGTVLAAHPVAVADMAGKILLDHSETMSLLTAADSDDADAPTSSRSDTANDASTSSVLVRPDLVVVLNPLENKPALNECRQMRIPTIGIVDTDCDPWSVTYPVPANDDSLRTVELVAGIFSRAAERGVKRRAKVYGMPIVRAKVQETVAA
ncbi:mitochondrial 37S ribosomal protein uS2m [Limtongia smithiae]|uniref:mitochondrial 37S ribosomal protein uS2m n=1 Tax=Limtongia smithiae TaxID=1125753 RepID=UPI0034CF7E4A